MSQEIQKIAQAIFVINRHAKTALEPKQLYSMKKQAIEKLLSKNHAKKIGLHYSRNSKFSKQASSVLIQVENYFFHIPPKKQDFKEVKHLGHLDENYRNPKTAMSLRQAKQIISEYLDIPLPKSYDNRRKRSSYETPSLLGRWNYSYYKNKKRR